MALTSALLIGAAFMSGALPFSLWVGRLALRTDIRAIGDGNPGATNVLRRGGWAWFALAALLDGLKGAVPVGLAYFALGWQGPRLIVLAWAPVAGHAFSPLLRFRGGKAVAVTFGIWAGLTVWEGPTVFGLLLGLWASLIATPGWAVMMAMISLLGYLFLTPASFNLIGARPPTSVLLGAWVGAALILGWKHRGDFRQPPTLRTWTRRLAASGERTEPTQ